MSGLQEAFYIIAIVFMGVMFILIIALLAAVFVIRNKVNKIQRTIEDKINTVTNIAEKGGEIAALAAGGAVRQAKKALGKSKK
jgi:cell division protein FtsL